MFTELRHWTSVLNITVLRKQNNYNTKVCKLKWTGDWRAEKQKWDFIQIEAYYCAAWI